ncbi:8-oxo-dGTP pyrophosphatase MutT (NUDIX family) [Lewinella marina]|uniref:GDP-mannose pyrophosphatase n=1 Tax=Neolewinella marina TaxID=438751 RepID=A0A2G0CIQ2_9BACT|nr:NUDIX hydrolase [Neolewinella marina]NJB85069.1 8-oxo-dGTP pyrophosphatase MutT (NUDIX family) [Neolewinella marina]PHK99790.1 DNA mismatch repair protein MutT [Neolewinella marina]
MSTERNPWTRKSTDIRYENPWIRVEHHEVVNPAGKDGIYGLVRYKNHAIGIVPIDEEGYTYLVGQYRYALDEYSWEIPEGGCPVGTSTLETAKRELREETGLVAAEWEHIMEFHLSNSVSDEWGVAYVARQLRQEAAEPEDTEDLRLRRVPLREAIEMTLDGRIKDALSILALQRVALMGIS